MTDRERTRRVALGSPDGLLAFGFGSGLSPFAPGTAGSLVAVPLALPLVWLPLPAALAVIAAAFLFGIWLCDRVGKRLEVHDHSGIVWDEFVGLWLVLVFVPQHWAWWLAAFLAFRLFDALKPWPIAWFDRRVHGGFGVMLDDLLAAGYALAVLWASGVFLR
ncbi:MAG: phosphatidylglycerophosphatase A [Alphaproteobacteria bacterium]|nr:phosphatidylglycerophosphatase A [Alphaproteobacteria bacterium]